MGRPGRPEAPVDHTIPELGALAQFLRDKRGSIPYSTLAQRSAWGASTLKRAASGKTMPTWDCFQGYLGACGIADGPEYERGGQLFLSAFSAWRTAHMRPKRWSAAPRPDLVDTEADLSRALRTAYEAAGRPPIREFVVRHGTAYLPRTTAHRIIQGRTMPVDVFQYLSFIRACGVPPSRLPDWIEAWYRARGLNPFSDVRFMWRFVPEDGAVYLKWLANQQVYPRPAWYELLKASAAA